MDEGKNPVSVEELRRIRRAAASRKKKKRRRRDLAALMSVVVATVVVVVERFLTEHTTLLLPSQTIALSASLRAAANAVSKLQTVLAISDHRPRPSQPTSSSSSTSSISVVPLIPAAASPDQYPGDPPSPSLWLDHFLSSADTQEWRCTFRMGKSAFFNLLRLLNEADTGDQPLQSSASNVCVAPPQSDVKLAATIYRLATAASPSVVARRFAIAGGAAGFTSIFNEVCAALQSKLSSVFDFPSTPEHLDPIIYQFAQQGLPNCCGVVGCTRFPVMPMLTSDNRAYFQSAGGYPAVAMQGVMDASGRLLDVSVGWGGSMSAALILQQSRLFARVTDSHELLHGRPVQLITGASVPQYIIGSAAYPLLPWLLTPYASPASPAQFLFNRAHAQARSIAGRVFETLKASWRLLTSGELTAADGGIIAATCILHNYLIYSDEPLTMMIEEAADEASSGELPSNLPFDESYGESIRHVLTAHLSALATSHSPLLPSLSYS